ncbi:acyl--CoA ligase [Actinosynnema pretiosum subsp. pretiosum]|uniref:Acyl--CoA ligase n=1 Tax=Actinosynnema pretiosum subsp. pretiosum TaxID=103721 RepID=A0AA45R4C6_9PSEU|nr:AMP-dependent synthetase and ligase [Actinosynnema pretiosum subsp. pretiosum]QUF04787.1 acyl--CoA ligase [Actinosynnema pretiosum subsp. pretiosum]
MTWVSDTGLAVVDLVPARLRAEWVRLGHCPDRDLGALLRERVAEHPGRVAVVDESGELDYAGLDRRVRALAGSLQERGIGPRSVVGVRLPNGIGAVVAELAVSAVGAVVLPLAGSDAEVAALAARARAALVLTGGLPGGGGFRPVEVDPEAPARVLVSSGSEGEPKLVAYSHNAFAGGRANYLRAVHGGVPEGARDLVLVPLSSAFGSFGAAITLCRFGGTLVLRRRFDAREALEAIARHRPDHVFGVPTMLRRMADLAASSSAAGHFSSVRAFVSSGDALPPSVLARCREVFGADVVSVYGSSDGVNCHTRTPERGVGRPDPAVTDVRVVDGEIRALGPMTPLSYVGAPELDARYRTGGGWVRTGDLGRFDADGVLHVVGRGKRVVLRGGYTISPAEVERELGAHPALGDVVCVPVPDEDLGQRLCACVTARPGAPVPGLGELTRYLVAERGVSVRKLPEFLLVLDELPVARTGKVCLRTLAAVAGRHHERERA